MSGAATQNSVVDELMAYVQSQGYGPGDRLPPIRKLSRVLGAGRNVVRDALLEAQSLGLVKIEPRQGVFLQESGGEQSSDRMGRALERVLGLEDQNLFHLIDARVMVETELAAEAARTRRPEDLLPLRQALEGVLAEGDDRAKYIEADERFHLAIARIAGNRVLLAFLEVLWRLIRPAKANFLLSPQNRDLSDREHQELFQAIVAGDAQRARTKMAQHLQQGRALLLEYACSTPASSTSTPAASRRAGDNLSKTSNKKKNGGKRS